MPALHSGNLLIALALLACTIAVPAARAEDYQPWEAGAGAGWLFPTHKHQLDEGPAALLTFGHRFTYAWGAEVFGIVAKTDFSSGAPDGDLRILGLRALYHFRGSLPDLTPYVSLGGTYSDVKGGDSEGSAVAGAGLKYALTRNWSLRAEINAHYGFDTKGTDTSVFAGIAYQWGRAPAPVAPVAAPVAAAAAPPATFDTDGDGVPDHLDKCPGTPKGVKVDSVGCPLKLTEQVSIRLNVNFDTGRADIKSGFAQEIQRVAEFMRRYPTTRVVIEGHTDNVGRPDYNQSLSERRAQAVAQSLVRDHGIAADRVQSVGYGLSRPIADNRTEEGRATNRRVTAEISETITRTQ